ncbi:hypothetical protein T11_10525 [Trichinella zimbabwensis]|uniref:Uncharacterized protein n=1 Tax=Trichinella zimbabwensis TaxID=268475 RepID=A0A0V1HEE9_9BILA|nr:hypothetical protein T11_10525 [Trichinella zimbabwensis]
MLDIGIKCFLGCTSTEEWHFYWKTRRRSIKWICDFFCFIIHHISEQQNTGGPQCDYVITLLEIKFPFQCRFFRQDLDNCAIKNSENKISTNCSAVENFSGNTSAHAKNTLSSWHIAELNTQER